jgi:peptide-methionine (R)-S-oxide reductase
LGKRKVRKSDAEWRAFLTPEQYAVTRRKGTERAFSGDYYAGEEEGTYVCVCCGNGLFDSEARYDSGSGWPSFWQPIAPDAVSTAPDDTLSLRRTEVLCAVCDAHLGHVFEDGPPPTGLRYCVNSAALKLVSRR